MQTSRFAAAIAEAGYNVMNLKREDITLDLASDVPAHSPFAEVREASGSLRSADLAAAARRLYGDWRFVFTTKGRGAELALARALVTPGMTVLTTGLFRTTQRAFTTNGATVEVMPVSFQQPGTSDVSLAWLDERLAAGRVDAVVLEPSNSAMFGWPMHLEHLQAVKRRCAAAGARLILDATRLLANCAALGDGTLDGPHAYLQLADAFVASCAKECLVPMGGVIGVRDLELQRRCWSAAFEEGTTLEVTALAAPLAAGFDAICNQPQLLTERRRLLLSLAKKLAAAGIRYVDPVGAHAVYALLDGADTPLRNHELQAFVFAHSGIRLLFGHHAAHAGFVVRLPLGLAMVQEADLDRIVAALRIAIDEASSVPALHAVVSDAVHPQYFGRYAPAT